MQNFVCVIPANLCIVHVEHTLTFTHCYAVSFHIRPNSILKYGCA